MVYGLSGLGILIVVLMVMIGIGSESVEERRGFVVPLLTSVKERPVTGWGWANVDYAMDSVVKRLGDTDQRVYVDKAHSSLLEVVVTTGVVGLGLYVWLWWSVLSRLSYLSVKDKKGQWKVWLMVMLGILVYSQTNVVGIASEVVFWFGVGLLMSKNITDLE